VVTKFAEELQKRSPEEQAEYKKDRKEILEFELEAFRDLHPQDVAEVVAEVVAAKLEPQTLVAGLTLEQIAARLSPEQRKKFAGTFVTSGKPSGRRKFLTKGCPKTPTR